MNAIKVYFHVSRWLLEAVYPYTVGLMKCLVLMVQTSIAVVTCLLVDMVSQNVSFTLQSQIFLFISTLVLGYVLLEEWEGKNVCRHLHPCISRYVCVHV